MAHPFQFVHYAPNLRGEDPLSTHVARSHTAKVNRRNLAKRNRPELLGGVQSSRTPRPARLVSCEYSQSESSTATPGKQGDSVDETVDSHDSSEKSKFGQSSQSQPLSSAISPVFGGHAMNAFDVAKSGADVAEVAHYVFNEVFSSCFSHDERTAWLEKFSQYSVVHHAFSYFRLFHQERVEGSLPVARSQRMLDESLQTFRLLNAKLDRLDDGDVEPVLLAMTLMFKDRENLGKENPSENHRLLFSPHMMQTELAGLDIGRVRQTEGYLPAVSLLVEQAGGIASVQDSGLARIMCMSDLIAASMHFTAPYFLCGWELDPAILVPGTYWQLPPEVEGAGVGFRSIAGGLPRLGTFMNLSAVNLAMAQHREKSLVGDDFRSLVYARNAAKHEVLSLPTWDDLPDSDRRGCHRELYECSRLAAVLYANAVVFPTLEEFPGIQEPTRRLRQVLESCDFTLWEDGVSEVFLWAIFVGGISASGSLHWNYFVSALRTCVANMSNASSDVAKSLLKRFVWSDIACDDGATILWNASCT